MLTWTVSLEHCHRCAAMTAVLVRWTCGRKRALCADCLPKDGA